MHAFEHAHRGFVGVAIVDHRAAGFAVESAAGGFGLPLFAVAVAVEMDGTAGANVVAQHGEQRFVGGFALGDEGIDAHLEVGEGFGHGGVEHDEGAGAVGRRTGGAELEAIAGEGEGRGAVAVGVVDEQLGNLRDVELNALFAGHGGEGVVGLCDAVEEFADLRAEEGGDDGGGRFVAAEAVGVAGAHDAGFQQTVVAIDAHERGDDEGEEAEGVAFGATGGVKYDAAVGAERPVAVFAATVDAGERFLVEEAAEAVLASDFAHERDEQHVVIDRQVALFVDGGELKLVGGHFVVTRLAGNAETEGLYFEIAHEFGHALGDGTEIVVFHLLILGAVVPHEGASGEQEVGARGVEAFVDEEVLLFPTEVGVYAHGLVVEVGANGFGGAVHCGDRLFERGFVVEGFAGVADEDGGNHQRVVDDEDGAGGIPRRVAAGFEGGADAAVGERGGIGLLLHKEFAGEVFDHATLAVVLHEGVVFLGGALGEGLEPVCIMRDAHLDGPLLHALCDGIGGVHIKWASGVEGFGVALIDFEGKILAHLLLVENVGGVIRRRTFGRCGHGDGAFFESLFHDFETECAHVLMPGSVAQRGRHAFGGWGK